MRPATGYVLPKVERSGNVTIITFVPHAIRDVENVIERELLGLTGGTGERHVLLDFGNVDCLNSLELGTLITLHKQVKAAGGRLTLFNLSAQVFELFTITRLDRLLEICRESAIVKRGALSLDGPAVPAPFGT